MEILKHWADFILTICSNKASTAAKGYTINLEKYSIIGCEYKEDLYNSKPSTPGFTMKLTQIEDCVDSIVSDKDYKLHTSMAICIDNTYLTDSQQDEMDKLAKHFVNANPPDPKTGQPIGKLPLSSCIPLPKLKMRFRGEWIAWGRGAPQRLVGISPTK